MFKTQKGNTDKNINAKTKIFEVYNNLRIICKSFKFDYEFCQSL